MRLRSKLSRRAVRKDGKQCAVLSGVVTGKPEVSGDDLGKLSTGDYVLS